MKKVNNKINYQKAKIIMNKIINIIKFTLFVGMLIGINIISNKLTSMILQLTFTQIKIGIFSILSTIILYTYLKSCEEIKKIENNMEE